MRGIASLGRTPSALLLISLCHLGWAVAADEVVQIRNQTVVVISNTIGDVPVTSPERITYQCTYRNLWTKQRQPINYPEEEAMWRGPIMWTHSSQLQQTWGRGKSASPGLEKFVEGESAIDMVQEFQRDIDNFFTYTENPQFYLELSTSEDGVPRKQHMNMYPIEVKQDYPYLSAIAGMYPSPDWFTGFYNFSLTNSTQQQQGGESFWFDHIKLQSYVWDAGTDSGVTYLGGGEDSDSDDSSSSSSSIQPGGIPGLPFKLVGVQEEEASNQNIYDTNSRTNSTSPTSSPTGSTTNNDDSMSSGGGNTIERIIFPDNNPSGGDLLGADMANVPVVAEWECFLHVGPRDLILPRCDWFANPCCNETDKKNCGSSLPHGVNPSITEEYKQVIQETGIDNIVTTNAQMPSNGDDNQDDEGSSDEATPVFGIFGTVWEVIQNNSNLSNFARALEIAGLDSILKLNDREYTIFAPSNEAIIGDEVFFTYMSEDGWVHHLETNLQLMIVPDAALIESQIFNNDRTELTSLNGTLNVSQSPASINLVTVHIPDLVAGNGVVHVMKGVMKNHWRQYTLRDVGQHDELVKELSPILDRIRFDDPLNTFVPSGTSWVAATNRAYSQDSVALGFDPLVQELKDPNNVDYQEFAMMYNLLDLNIYEQDFQTGDHLLVLPRNEAAHMVISKDGESGILRFNDAELDRQTFADNGITQIVKKPLVPPGLAMLLDYIGQYTTINSKEIAQYYKSSEWDWRNLSQSIGTGLGNFSVFVPLEGGFGEAFSDIASRLYTLEWVRHLRDFLLHLTTEPARTTSEWHDLVQDSGGSLQVKMLSGFNTTLEIDGNGDLTIDGAPIMRPFDIRGIDGYIHFVEQAPLPPSVLGKIYDQTQQKMEMTTVARLMDTVQLGNFIDNLLPVTFFSAENKAWDLVLPSLQINDVRGVLNNMLFEQLLFDDYLADMDGQTIKSANGNQWAIQVFNDPRGEPLRYAPQRSPVKIYISNAEGPAGLTNCTLIPGPYRTNILARTGIIHRIDCLFLDYNYTKDSQEGATSAPTGPSDAGPSSMFSPTGAPSTAPTTPGDETQFPSGNATPPVSTAGPSFPLSPAPTSSTFREAQAIQVKSSFDIYNTEGLTAADLMSPENRAVLLEAFSGFISSVVASLESGQKERRLRVESEITRIRQRMLSVTLQPGSADIYDVIDVKCGANSPVSIPQGASCQTVFGRYDLEVSANEDEDVVLITYSQATNDAIGDGKLQGRLWEAAANSKLSSISIAGPSLQPKRTSTVDNTSTGQRRDPWCDLFAAMLMSLAFVFAV